MEDAYYAGNSNPQHRRFEMMATMKGLENIAEFRGDEAVFFTVTCPSRFHANLDDGHLNPKWDGSTIRDSSDYLVNVFFAGVRKKLNRLGLRWYGIRVAEPNQDGTVHWHLVIFMRPEEREAITDVMREFAIRDDRAELGDDITPRFKSGLITSDKGSPTGYIALYIGKNVDAGAVGGVDPKTGKERIDHESGKSMAESVEHAIGWASLHGVRQFQFFGISSRQVYRELRRLAMQMARHEDGPQQLSNKAMDDVLVAADAGCLADEPNDYGETGMQIFGIWSPLLGRDSRVCTHPDNWELVRKKPATAQTATSAGVDLDVKGGIAAPWTRGNNCPPEQNPINDGGSIGASDPHRVQPPTTVPADEPVNFENLSRKERRELFRRLKATSNTSDKVTPAVLPGLDRRVAEEIQRKAMLQRQRQEGLVPRAERIADSASSIGIELTHQEAMALAAGATFEVGSQRFRAGREGELLIMKQKSQRPTPEETQRKAQELMQRLNHVRHIASA